VPSDGVPPESFDSLLVRLNFFEFCLDLLDSLLVRELLLVPCLGVGTFLEGDPYHPDNASGQLFLQFRVFAIPGDLAILK